MLPRWTDRVRGRWRYFGPVPVAVLTQSLRLSAAHRLKGFLDLPIVAARGTRLVRQPGGQVDLGGQLFLGYEPPHGNPNGAVRPGATLLTVQTDGRFRTTGWALIGPRCDVLVSERGALTMGEGTCVTSDTRIICHEQIVIGEGCAISWEVLIMDGDGHWLAVDGEQRPSSAPIRIGNRVWIGAGSKILKGVTIGDGAVIGAGSIVTKDIPAGCLAAGTPARVLRRTVEWC